MEIRLSDNTKLLFLRTPSGTLRVELWRPGTYPDGQGWRLESEAQLTGEELVAFVRMITMPLEERYAGDTGPFVSE